MKSNIERVHELARQTGAVVKISMSMRLKKEEEWLVRVEIEKTELPHQTLMYEDGQNIEEAAGSIIKNIGEAIGD